MWRGLILKFQDFKNSQPSRLKLTFPGWSVHWTPTTEQTPSAAAIWSKTATKWTLKCFANSFSQKSNINFEFSISQESLVK